MRGLTASLSAKFEPAQFDTSVQPQRSEERRETKRQRTSASFAPLRLNRRPQKFAQGTAFYFAASISWFPARCFPEPLSCHWHIFMYSFAHAHALLHR